MVALIPLKLASPEEEFAVRVPDTVVEAGAVLAAKVMLTAGELTRLSLRSRTSNREGRKAEPAVLSWVQL